LNGPLQPFYKYYNHLNYLGSKWQRRWVGVHGMMGRGWEVGGLGEGTTIPQEFSQLESRDMIFPVM
jgi:hypothetical protein